jgi:ribose 5-phosphate isomerase A
MVWREDEAHRTLKRRERMEITLDKEQVAKEAAARYAAGLVEDGMVVGLGTGSTAEPFVHALGQRVRAGLRILGVPTSKATERLSRSKGIPLTTLEERPQLDIAVDGADAVDPALNLLKGLGGALLREKIVAHAAARFLVIVHEAKLVGALTEAPLVPVEVVPFGWSRTKAELEGLGATVTRRESRNGQHGPFVTDGGHYVLDCRFADLSDPATMAAQIKALIGVVEHGLFIGMADTVIVGAANGSVRVLKARHRMEVSQ